jgi:hypothetical protein
MTKYYLGFFHNKTNVAPFARLIEWVERRSSSHCEIIAVDDYDIKNAVCYGSVWPKSRSISLTEMKLKYETQIFIPLNLAVTDQQARIILESLMNKPYSLTQNIIIGIKILCEGLSGFLSGVKLNLSRCLNCTELAGIFMQEACNYRFSQSVEALSLTEVESIGLKNLIIDEVVS